MVPKEAEVVVIGGGVVGSSVAYFLAQAGKKVVLVEKGCKAGKHPQPMPLLSGQ